MPSYLSYQAFSEYDFKNKKKGLSFGVEKYTNSTFDSNVIGYTSGNAELTITWGVGGTADCTTINEVLSSWFIATPEPTLTVGKTYRHTMVVSEITAGAQVIAYIADNGGFGTWYTTPGTYIWDYTPTVATTIHRWYVRNSAVGGGTVKISEWSIKEIL